MDYQFFTQFGISGAALAVLYFTLKESFKRMKEQNEFLKNLTDNHFQHSIDNMKELTIAVTKLSEKIK